MLFSLLVSWVSVVLKLSLGLRLEVVEHGYQMKAGIEA